jgi:hypothetical protein
MTALNSQLASCTTVALHTAETLAMLHTLWVRTSSDLPGVAMHRAENEDPSQHALSMEVVAISWASCSFA